MSFDAQGEIFHVPCPLLNYHLGYKSPIWTFSGEWQDGGNNVG